MPNNGIDNLSVGNKEEGGPTIKIDRVRRSQVGQRNQNRSPPKLHLLHSPPDAKQRRHVTASFRRERVLPNCWVSGGIHRKIACSDDGDQTIIEAPHSEYGPE